MLPENQEVVLVVCQQTPELLLWSDETNKFYRIFPIEKEHELTSMIYQPEKPMHRQGHRPLSFSNQEEVPAMDRLNF